MYYYEASLFGLLVYSEHVTSQKAITLTVAVCIYLSSKMFTFHARTTLNQFSLTLEKIVKCNF